MLVTLRRDDKLPRIMPYEAFMYILIYEKCFPVKVLTEL